MKVRRTVLLFVLFALVLSQIIVPRHPNHKALGIPERMMFTTLLTDLRIPDEVNTVSSPGQTAVAGSSVSIWAPHDYAAFPDFGRFVKNCDTTIDISEDYNVGFTAYSSIIDHALADMAKCTQDVTLLYKKKFTFNNYDAMALYLYDEHRGITYVYMAFGDEHFHVAMKGSCRATDFDERDRILGTFLTAGVRI